VNLYEISGFNVSKYEEHWWKFIANKQVQKKLSNGKVYDIYLCVIPHTVHFDELHICQSTPNVFIAFRFGVFGHMTDHTLIQAYSSCQMTN